jgi:hypothetical protein
MASVPDFPGQVCLREGLVFRLGSEGLIDCMKQQRSAGIFAGVFAYD